MSTVDHVTAALGRLRAAWGWLQEATVPGPTRRHQRQMGEIAKRNLDRQAAAERADRHALLTSKRVPTGHTRAPSNISALDARARIAGDLDALAWLMASRLRTPYRPHGATADTTAAMALDWIADNVAKVDDHRLLVGVYEQLVIDTEFAKAVAGAGAQRRPFAAECPACGRRSLFWDVSSPHETEHHVACGHRRCRCSGMACPCRLPDRRPGMDHVWLQRSWLTLAAILNQGEAS